MTDAATAAAESHAVAPEHRDFARDLLHGLSQTPRRLSPKYFYDAAGSALFDRICALPEYYPTRTEMAILRKHAPEIVRCIGTHANIIEFGAGSLDKVRVLLDAFHTDTAPDRYIPIDISDTHLQSAAERLRRDYPMLEVSPLAADYMQPAQLHALDWLKGRRAGFFPGSTLGNFEPSEAATFLARARRMLAGGGLLIGVDLVKDERTLYDAYNDSEGVTDAFNLNLLVRANRELGANFDLNAFTHLAFYNPDHRRIEMHLRSVRAQRAQVLGHTFSFAEGETIHTENSHKYTIDSLRALARVAGFVPGPVWTDDKQHFSVHWWESPGNGCGAPASDTVCNSNLSGTE